MTAVRLGWHLIQAGCVTYVTICTLSWCYCYGLPYLKVRSEMKAARAS